MLLLFSRPVVSDSCDPMDYSTPGCPLSHHLPKFAQVHVHCINDAIQPSHPVMSSSSALNLSQHRELFQISIQQLSICLNMKSAIQGLKLKAVIHGWIEKQARIRKKIILDNYDNTTLTVRSIFISFLGRFLNNYPQLSNCAFLISVLSSLGSKLGYPPGITIYLEEKQILFW